MFSWNTLSVTLDNSDSMVKIYFCLDTLGCLLEYFRGSALWCTYMSMFVFLKMFFFDFHKFNTKLTYTFKWYIFIVVHNYCW